MGKIGGTVLETRMVRTLNGTGVRKCSRTVNSWPQVSPIMRYPLSMREARCLFHIVTMVYTAYSILSQCAYYSIFLSEAVYYILSKV